MTRKVPVKHKRTPPAGPQAVFHFEAAEFAARLLPWHRRHRRPLPWRKRFRETSDPYCVWVSEIMLQQTVIKAVIPVYERFMTAFPDIASLAQAPDDAVRKAVRGLGYYRRFRLMHAAAKEIEGAGNTWPRTTKGLQELPGIGAYTSAAIASIAFGVPAAVLDGNVERVLSRIFDQRTAVDQPGQKRLLKSLADQLVPARNPGHYNEGLMELGQTICTPDQPACDQCPVAILCLARQRNSQKLAPPPRARPQMTDVRLTLVVARRRGRIMLVERHATEKFLAGSSGFLTVSGQPNRNAGRNSSPESRHDSSPDTWRPVGSVRHTITSHRITADVVLWDMRPGDRVPDGRKMWLSPVDVEENLIANLDRKAWTRLVRAVPELN